MTRKLRLLVVAISVLSCTCFTHLQAQPGSRPAARPQPKPFFANHDQCVTCHFPKPGVQGVATNSLDFIQTTPSTVWQDEDKHRKAFTLLLADENRAIVTQMIGFDMREFVKDGQLAVDSLQPPQLERVKQCLHCHAAWPNDSSPPELRTELGVSCQACHGPGFHWFQPHQDKMWRLVSPQEKSRLHMTDVRSPATRAKLCTSCHVGDLKRGRYLTHEMYANGHPPLPSFELESFASQMPPHWRSLPEKPVFDLWSSRPAGFDAKVSDWLEKNATISPTELRAGYRQANFASQHDPRQDLPHARNAIVAGAVLLQAYLNVAADLTNTPSGESRGLPEFAMFDCTACHHELRTGPLETGRPFRRSPPGRPPMPLWPTALVRAGIAQLAVDDADRKQQLAAFEKKLQSLETAVTRQPFGNAQQINLEAKEMSAWLEDFAIRLERSQFDKSAAKRTLLFLADPNNHEIRDYHSARQVAWAIRQMVRDVDPKLTPAEVAALFIGPDGKDVLSLNLPAGQQKSVVRNLKDSLDAIAAYDPNWFAAELKRIQTLIADK